MSLAYFIDPSCADLADVYRDNFQPSIFTKEPRVSLGVFSICADTDKEAEELSLNLDDPYINLVLISQNSTFIAKKAKTFEAEKKVAEKAPIDGIKISDLNLSLIHI